MKILVAKRNTLFLGAALLLSFVLSVWALSASGAYAVFYNRTVRELPIYSVEREEKVVAITFDAAWGTEHTDEILARLAEKNVKATFFLVEFWTKKYPDYVKKIAEAGHAIGTHSATHGHMSKMSEAIIQKELSTSSAAITEITGQPVTLFRPPYGDYNDRLMKTAKSMGLYSIQWDVDSLDWKDLSAGDIAKRVVPKVKNGSIILCHNNGKHTAEALPVILEALQNAGYRFVTVEELIYKENYQMDANGRQFPA